MKVSDFKKDEFYSLQSECNIWGRPAVIYVEFIEESNLYDMLAGFLAIINERAEMLDKSRQAVLDFILKEVTAERLGIDEKSLLERAFVSELTVFCDDGMNNVWVDAFVEFGEGTRVVQLEISPKNEIGLCGLCG